MSTETSVRTHYIDKMLDHPDKTKTGDTPPPRRPSIPIMERTRQIGSAWTKMLDWAEAAAPGDTYIYHQGLLAMDRDTDAAADSVGHLAMDLAHRGLVALTQRRLHRGGFRYIATRLAA